MRGGDQIGGGDGGGGGGPPTGPAGGDLGGSYPSSVVVEAVQGVPVSATGPVAPGQVLKWDGVEASWAADAQGVDYTATLYVDPSGDPASDGKSPAKPTALANALATVPVNGCIKVEAGTYATPVTAGITCTIVGAETAQPTSAHAAVKFTGLLTITAPNVQVVGVLLQGGVSDQSSAAGATRFSECSIPGPITMASPASGQILEFNRTDFGATTVAGASGGATIRAKGCRSGTSITSTASGAVIVQLSETTLNGALTLNNAGGSMSVLLTNASIGSQVRTAGSITGFVAVNSHVGSLATPAAVDLTGAGAATVSFVNATFNRSGSTIPIGAETAGSVRGWPAEFLALVAGNWKAGTPTDVQQAIRKLANGEFAYGSSPVFWRDQDVDSNVTVTPPNFPEAISYLTSGGVVNFEPGIYIGFTFAFFEVGANNTQIYWDLWVGGAQSTTGFAAFPMGLAGAADTRTAGVAIFLPVPVAVDFDLKFGRYGGTNYVRCKNAGYCFIRVGNFP